MVFKFDGILIVLLIIRLKSKFTPMIEVRMRIEIKYMS